jgi:uroporphyrinogen-III synthase
VSALPRRVIITRPIAQAEKWRAQLDAAGIASVLVPLLELRGVSAAEQTRAIKNVVLDFDLYQKAIFVSQNAVDFAMQWLEDYWPQLPVGIEYFAVGETTARHLQQHGIKVSALTAAETGAMNSESLLQVAELQQVDGEKIIIFRGCGGRGHMGEILQARGANVTYCELYERHLPAQAADNLREVFTTDLAWQYRNIVALHSGESLQHYQRVLDQLERADSTAELAKRVRLLPVLVPGERVAQLANQAGFRQVHMAENATDASMLSALHQII